MEITDLGFITILAALVAERLYQYLRSRGIDLQEMNRKIDELYEWHKETDTNGVRRMYFREDARQALMELRDTVRGMKHDLRQVDRKVEEIWRRCMTTEQDD